jgi:hypothetical protein
LLGNGFRLFGDKTVPDPGRQIARTAQGPISVESRDYASFSPCWPHS